jgi:hypothetical protein
LGNVRAQAVAVLLRGEDDDLFGVAEDRNVGFVRRDEELALLLGVAQATDDTFVDEAVIQVVLGLVEDQWAVALQQREQEDRRAALASGEAIEWAMVAVLGRPDVERDLDAVLERHHLQLGELLVIERAM